MRLFIAVQFSEEVKRMLADEIKCLKEQAVSGNFTSIVNLHLTVAFLGEVPQKRTKCVADIIEQVCKGCPSAVISVNGFGKFKKYGEILYWRGMECTGEFVTMQKRLVMELKAAGFPVDDKPFKPHITMGRRCVMKEGFSESDFQDALAVKKLEVEEICLMKSERRNGKMVYTKLAGVKSATGRNKL